MDKMLAESMVDQLVELKANYMVALMEHQMAEYLVV
jgi:hypothetical protein